MVQLRCLPVDHDPCQQTQISCTLTRTGGQPAYSRLCFSKLGSPQLCHRDLSLPCIYAVHPCMQGTLQTWHQSTIDMHACGAVPKSPPAALPGRAALPRSSADGGRLLHHSPGKVRNLCYDPLLCQPDLAKDQCFLRHLFLCMLPQTDLCAGHNFKLI